MLFPLERNRRCRRHGDLILLHQGFERLAFDVLHGEVMPQRRLADLVDLDGRQHDVGEGRPVDILPPRLGESLRG